MAISVAQSVITTEMVSKRACLSMQSSPRPGQHTPLSEYGGSRVDERTLDRPSHDVRWSICSRLQGRRVSRDSVLSCASQALSVGYSGQFRSQWSALGDQVTYRCSIRCIHQDMTSFAVSSHPPLSICCLSLLSTVESVIDAFGTT